jgi:hypothetical protein
MKTRESFEQAPEEKPWNNREYIQEMLRQFDQRDTLPPEPIVLEKRFEQLDLREALARWIIALKGEGSIAENDESEFIKRLKKSGGFDNQHTLDLIHRLVEISK